MFTLSLVEFERVGVGEVVGACCLLSGRLLELFKIMGIGVANVVVVGYMSLQWEEEPTIQE